MKRDRLKYQLLGLFICALLISGCKKLPEVKDYLNPNANFNKKEVYEPILGRTTLEKTEFNADGSTYPLKFSIENIRNIANSSDGSELLQENKVQVWTRDYTGLEESISEIEGKRVWVEKPFLDIVQGSGDLIFWKASSHVIKTFPSEGYLFDIKVQNKGNESVYR